MAIRTKPANTQPLPLSGYVFRLIDNQFWRASILPKRLRKLGAKIVSKDNAKTTHLVTPSPPIAPFQPNNGSLFGNDFATYVTARSFIEKANPRLVCMSGDQLSALVIATEQAVRAKEADRREQCLQQRTASLQAAPQPGFVGL